MGKKVNPFSNHFPGCEVGVARGSRGKSRKKKNDEQSI